MKHSLVPRKPSTKPTSMNSESGHFNSFHPIPPKVGFSDSRGRGSKQSSHGRLQVLLRALFLVPQRRVAPLATAIPAGGAPRAPVPRWSCQAWLEAAPAPGAASRASAFVPRMRKGHPQDPAIPLLGVCPEELNSSRVCTATFAAA